MSLISCQKDNTQEIINISEGLQLIKLSPNGYVHKSLITLQSGAQYACNGFVYINKKEAYIFDTPANELATTQLIHWIQDSLKLKIKGVVFNHFHRDCIAGIAILKKCNIPTIASTKTKELMLRATKTPPDLIFEDRLLLKLGNKTIINTYFGEAHSADNIVSYFPDEELLFGGCMIKSLKAKKGNLADANTTEWSNTVENIKKAYPNLKTIIPGHGAYGDTQLLTYTIALFETKNNNERISK